MIMLNIFFHIIWRFLVENRKILRLTYFIVKIFCSFYDPSVRNAQSFYEFVFKFDTKC